MSGIDSRIVIIGLPAIGKQTGASLSQLIWVTQAYLLASTVALPIIGRVSDIAGRVRIYNIGFLIFTIGSALASISFSPYELIASRLVQGTGSAMLITNSAAILTDATPRKELGTLLGINQIAFRVGSVAGLTLSGVILAITDWRALFYINIPIGLFGTIWAHRRLREISTKDTERRIDWSGFVVFSSALTLLLLAVTLLSYGLSGVGLGLGLLVSGLALLVLFVVTELKHSAPLLDITLFKIKEFAAANVAQALFALVFSGAILILSFYLQIELGESALVAGISIIPLDAAFLLAGPISGHLSDKYGPRLLASSGLALGAIAFIVMATVTDSGQNYDRIVLGLVLLGVGSGMFTSPNTSAIMGSVPANRRGVASGFRATTFNASSTASYSIVVLIMTLAIPYSTFSALIRGTASQSIQATVTAVARAEFLSGFKIAVLILAAIEAIAIVPSLLRGKETLGQYSSQVHNEVID